MLCTVKRIYFTWKGWIFSGSCEENQTFPSELYYYRYKSIQNQ